MKTMLKSAQRTASPLFPRCPISLRVRTARCVAPLALSLLSLGLLTGAACQAHAEDGDPISADAGPTVINWPGNHFAMFTIKYGDTVKAYLGDQPSAGSSNANWTGLGQAECDFNFRLKDRPQVVSQPNNKTLVFVNDNNQKIWCCSMKADNDNKIQNTNESITSMTINGGFDSYCVIPLPDKHFEDGLKQEVYPMLLVYIKNGLVCCERLDWLLGNGPNKSWFYRSSVNHGALFSVGPTEKKISACLVPSRDPATAAAFPYNLIVTTTAEFDKFPNKGVILARSLRLDPSGYVDPSLLTVKIPFFNTVLANPNINPMGGPIDGRCVKMSEDIIAYVGADGRPAVNCMDTNRNPMHYVCDLDKGGQWRWDGTYDSSWDNATYRWTPTTHYYTSSKVEDQTVNRVTVPGVVAPSTNLTKKAAGPYENDHEIIRPVFRYALGGMPTKYFMTGASTKMYNAHLKPVKFYPADQIKSLLIGIIEGPPPIPWQNINVSSPAAASVYGSTIVNLATAAQKTIDTQTSTELIAQTAGAVGVAWDISASIGFQDFGSISSQKISSTDIKCDFTINAPPSGSSIDAKRDIATLGTAVLLKQDCELYNYTITPINSDTPVSGSVTYQQVALKKPTLVTRPYTMSRKHGIVQSSVYMLPTGQGLVAGRLSSYSRPDAGLFDSYPMYSPDPTGNNAFSSITFSWGGAASGSQSQAVNYSSTTGTGTSFSLQVLVGIGTGDASIMAGFQSSGSIMYSTTNTNSASLQSFVAGVATNYSQPGLYTQYDYDTYWLQGSQAWTTSFLNVLADSPNNAILANMIAPDSTPWVVTYGLNGAPTWNGSSWDRTTATYQDWAVSRTR